MRPTDHDSRSPFDHESDDRFDQTDLNEEFWGDARSWDDQTVRRDAPLAPRGDDTTGTIRAIRDGVAAFRPQRMDLRDSTGQMRRNRVHGSNASTESPPRPEPRSEASIGELAAGRFEGSFDDATIDDISFDDPRFGAVEHGFDDRDEIPLSPVEPRPSRFGIGAVDPLLARFGALALVGVLLVPVALALRSSDPDSNNVLIESPTPTEVVAESQAPAGGAEQTGTAADSSAATSSNDADTGSQATASESVAADPSSPAGQSEGSGGEPSDAVSATGGSVAEARSEAVGEDTQSAAATDGAIDEAATVDATAERVVPECPQTYSAGAGDSWYQIAEAAGVTPNAVMAENRATGETVILPGDEICLPADATIPSPPTATTTPDTTDAPTSTAAPATTAAPTTTSAPAEPASVEEVKALIRQTWPVEEHETAMMIARRESKFDPRADNNWCCYGVFQIYFEVHKGWLDDFGVYRASDLFDAEKNIAAAYHLYEQAGGWGPWGF